MLDEGLGMDKILEKILKATNEGIIESGINVVFGPVGPLITKYGEIIKEKFESEPTIHFLALEECKDFLPEEYAKYVPIIITAVELCIEQLDLIESYNYEKNKCVEKITAQYINRYDAHFEEDELGVLKNFLKVIIEKTLESLYIEKESDPEYQVKFKKAISGRMDVIDATLTEHGTEISSIKKELKDVSLTISSVKECHERYKNDWNKKMFLTDNIKLRDLYKLPYYEDKEEGPYKNLDERLRTVLNSGDDIEKRMLLILGHPGNGKTTLMTYVLNHYSTEFAGRAVRMYCFRSFKAIDWNDCPENLFGEMLRHMGLDVNDLSNSVLILDGLDEVNMSNNQIEFLNCLCEDWVESTAIKNFSLFVTCRVNRISFREDLTCPYIQLCPLQEDQIGPFVENYNSFDPHSVNTKELIEELLRSNEKLEDVLGIPLVLYMILALRIKLQDETNLVEVYEQIFSIKNENSIYFRKNYDHKAEHPITNNEAKLIHQFSKDIAIHMWKDEEQQVIVKKEDYERIAEEITSNVDVRGLLIGQYFVEGKDSCELYFVHRSMYQYFVALSIFDSIKNMIEQGSPSEQFKELVGNSHSQKNSCISTFARIAGMNVIYSDPDIEQYLLYMLKNLTIHDGQWWKTFFERFLDKGLTRYVDPFEESTINCFALEVNRFYNLIWLTREQLRSIGSSECPYEVANVDAKFLFYLGRGKVLADLREINLADTDLREVNFYRVDLREADLSGANLYRAGLWDAYLEEVNLNGANLREADLCFANLRGADLSGANLSKADFSIAELNEADLDFADLRGANLRGAYLRGASLSRADLREANLSGAKLSGANLNYTDLSGAILDDIIVDKDELRKAILDEENYKKFFGDGNESDE